MKYQTQILIASVFAMFSHASDAQTYTETTGENGAVESQYGATRGWEVLSGSVNGRFVYCVAEHPNRSVPLRLGNSINQQWQLSILQPLARVREDWQGGIEVDGDNRYARAAGSASGDWTVAWLGMGALGAIKDGNTMIFGVGKYDFDYNLAGATAAVLKVEECIQNEGRIPLAAAQPQSQLRAQPQPRAQPQSQPRAQPRQPANNVAVPRNANGQVIENDAYRTGDGCPKIGAVVSPYSTDRASAEFIDQTSHQNGAVTVYWLDDQGTPYEAGIFDNGMLNLNTYVGHSFIVKDRNGNCYGGVYKVNPGNNQFIVY